MAAKQCQECSAVSAPGTFIRSVRLQNPQILNPNPLMLRQRLTLCFAAVLPLLFLQNSKYLLTFSLPKLYDNEKKEKESLMTWPYLKQYLCPLLRGICLDPLFPAPGQFKKCQSLSSCRSFFCSGCGLLFFVFWKLYCCRSLFLRCPVLLLPGAPCFPAQVLAYGGRRHTCVLSWFFPFRRILGSTVPHGLFLSFLPGR